MIPLQGDSSHSGTNTSAALTGNNGTGGTNLNNQSITLNSIRSASPSSFRTVQPTIILNMITRVL